MSLAGIIHTTERDDMRVDSEATLRREPLEKGGASKKEQGFPGGCMSGRWSAVS